jgi:hypothetical protein
MSSVDELRHDLAECKHEIEADNNALLRVREELQPWWQIKAEAQTRLMSSLEGVTIDNDPTIRLNGFAGPRVTVPSVRWVGPAKGGYGELCRRTIIEVTNREYRREVYRILTEQHEKWRPLLQRQRELRADVEAGIRLMNRLGDLIEKATRPPPKKRQADTSQQEFHYGEK